MTSKKIGASTFRAELRVCLLLLATIIALASPVHSAEKEQIPTAPPLAKTGTTTAFLDQPVEITLHLAGRIAEPLSFLIRKAPKHGKLSGLRRISRNSAAVLYTPDPDAGPGDDFFSFAAQSVDSAVSAPATVWIRLAERPAVLEHPAQLDFGKVFLGDKAERSLTIKNTGGGVAIGTLRPNSPWSTLKSADFRVPAGTESAITLVFEPWEERDFSDRIQVGQDPQAVVMVRGSGVAPVSWPKEGLVVSPSEREKGSASITFSNNSSSERQLTVGWPEFLIAPKEMILPPGGSSLVRVGIKAASSLNCEQEAEIRSGNYSGRLPIRMFPAPARLSVSPERELRLEASGNGRSLKGRFSVSNTGGSSTSLEILVPAGILIHPGPSGILVAAGTEQTFEIHAEKPKSGSIAGTIRINCPGCNPVEISIKSPAVSENRAAVPVEDFLKIPSVPEPTPVTAPPSGKAPPVESASLVASGTHEVEVSWKVLSPKTSGFRIDRRRISPGNEGQVAIDWIPWPEPKITISDNTAVARFQNLPADSFWIIRIVSLDENGKPSAPSPSFRISTRPAWKLHLPWWAWMFVPGALGGAALLVWKRNQRGLHAIEDKRIARLDGQ